MSIIPKDPYASIRPGMLEALRLKWPDASRLTVAWSLAPDIVTAEDLLRGHYVDPVRLDPEWLRWAKREQFVALKPALETLVA